MKCLRPGRSWFSCRQDCKKQKSNPANDHLCEKVFRGSSRFSNAGQAFTRSLAMVPTPSHRAQATA